jgi:antitoxin FitA
MEAEARAILGEALAPAGVKGGLGSRIRSRFGELGSFEFELPDRDDEPRASAFEE